MPDETETREGYIYGGWRQAVNAFGTGTGSIHDDETARNLGMRGGAVVGIVHLNLFPPLLLKTFGQRWFEQGSLSIYYTYALTDGEQVRGVMADLSIFTPTLELMHKLVVGGKTFAPQTRML